jgi:hypothetical protein
LVAQARKAGLNIELQNLDHRVIGEALVERVGQLIEIVEDTTRTTLGTPRRYARTSALDVGIAQIN